jgi:hypothetical protein
MTADEVAEVYAASRQKALDVIRANGIMDSAVAEDAVQEAALYFLERLEKDKLPLRQEAKLDRVTPSLFCQVAWRFAQHSVDPKRFAKVGHEFAVGDSCDLAELE